MFRNLVFFMVRTVSTSPNPSSWNNTPYRTSPTVHSINLHYPQPLHQYSSRLKHEGFETTTMLHSACLTTLSIAEWWTVEVTTVAARLQFSSKA